MRRGWLAKAVGLSAAFQVALWVLPVGALPVEILGLLGVTAWAARLYLLRARQRRHGHRHWLLLGVVSLLLWFVALASDGIGLLAGASLSTRMTALTSIAQGALGCAIVTLLRLPGLRQTRRTVIWMVLDGAAVGFSLSSLAWAALFGVSPVVDADAPGALALITVSASLLVLLSASLPIFVGRSQTGPTSLGSFAGGIAVMAFGALAAVFASLAGDPTPETVAGGALFFGTALIGRAALLPMPTFVRRASGEYPSPLAQAVPYLVLLVLALIAAVHQALVQEINLVLTGMLFLLAVAVLTRQFLALTTNARLTGELTRQRARLAYQAFHDPLTGLANRALFAERLATALAPGQPAAAVLLVDLDGFKAVNDARGHAAGDQLLVVVARRLRTAVRSADTVARMGGDEFAVLLPGCGDEADATTVARTILDRIARPVVLGEATLGLRASIGIAVAGPVGHAVSDPETTADALLRAADLALYRSKQDGKNQFRLADRELSERSLDRSRLEEELREAIAHGPGDEFEVHYQPIVDLRTEDVVGAEAVLRWRHPDRGLLRLAEFRDAALAAGLLTALDRRILRVVCQDARDWLGSAPALTVSVNVCAASVTDAALADAVAGLLIDTRLRPEALELAVSESALVADVAAAGAALEQLRGLGVRVALDDFGAGYGSLTCLRVLPIHTLRLDSSFVAAACPIDEALTRSVLGLAGTLGLRTVATGVATARQAVWLREFGCDQAQGWLFGAPVSAVQFDELVRSAARTDSVA